MSSTYIHVSIVATAKKLSLDSPSGRTLIRKEIIRFVINRYIYCSYSQEVISGQSRWVDVDKKEIIRFVINLYIYCSYSQEVISGQSRWEDVDKKEIIRFVFNLYIYCSYSQEVISGQSKWEDVDKKRDYPLCHQPIYLLELQPRSYLWTVQVGGR